MAKKKRSIGLVKDSEAYEAVCSAFDANLNVVNRAFEDSVTVCDLEVTSDIRIADEKGVLQFDDSSVNLTRAVMSVGGIANSRTFMFYFHFHDNVVDELAMLRRFDIDSFLECFDLFATIPADQGGKNILGVIDTEQKKWLFVIEVDNAGNVSVEFFGTSALCESFRLQLGA